VKRTAVILLVLVLFGSVGAKAQQFDLSTMTCDSFLKGDKDRMKLITAWLAGYYTDASALNKMQDQLVKFCSRETSFPIENAADGIFGQEAATGSDAPGSSPETSQSGH
jgi:hypothetical protein